MIPRRLVAPRQVVRRVGRDREHGQRVQRRRLAAGAVGGVERFADVLGDRIAGLGQRGHQSSTGSGPGTYGPTSSSTSASKRLIRIAISGERRTSPCGESRRTYSAAARILIARPTEIGQRSTD